MIRTVRTLKQRMKDFYMQLPDKLEKAKSMVDEVKPAVVKDSMVMKDSGLIVSAFIGLVLGVIFGAMIGATLQPQKILRSLTIFAIVHVLIGLFKNHYLQKKNSRKVDAIDTLLFIEICSCLITLGITIIGYLVTYVITLFSL